MEQKNKIPLQVFLRALSNLPNHWKHKTETKPSIWGTNSRVQICVCVWMCVFVCMCVFSLLSPSKSYPLSLSINVFLLHTEEKSSQLYQLNFPIKTESRLQITTLYVRFNGPPFYNCPCPVYSKVNKWCIYITPSCTMPLSPTWQVHVDELITYLQVELQPALSVT